MNQPPPPNDGAPKSRGIALHMLVLATPMIITQYASVVMQFVDAWMLGALGSAELAAVGPAGLLVQVAICYGAGYLSGVITLVSHAYGRGEHTTSLSCARQGLRAAAVIGIISVALWPAAPAIFPHFASTPAVLRYEIDYFQVSLLSIPPQLIAIAIANYFIGVQRTGIAMIGSIVGMLSNVVLNYTLIFGSFGFPQLGFIGAAWGTVTASCIQALIMCTLLVWHYRHIFHPHDSPKRGHHAHREHRALLRRIGLPAGVQGAIDILSWGVLLMWLIKPFGEEHQAAATVLMRCMQVSFLPADGFAAALHTLVGESMGKRDIKKAKHDASIALRIITFYMVGMGIIFYFNREPIMRLFSPDSEAVVQIGIRAMIFVSVFQLFDAFNVTFINALHGAGDTLWPSVVNAAFCLGILLLGGRLVTHHFPEFASLGVWFVSSTYIFAQGLAFFLRWHSGAWQKQLLD